jgi:dATP/dGTP diphosphohydrolase
MFDANEFKRAFETIIEVMRQGERNHLPDEWKSYPPGYHVSRAAEHLRLWQAGDTREDHLSHAATRLLLALTLRDIS